MATVYRRRVDAIGGLVEDNPLTSGATTLTSAGLAALGTLATDEYYPIKLDPDGIDGTPETVYITAHTAAATTATISRGAEGTTARAHDRDTSWVHTATVKDFDGRDGGTGLLAYNSYAAGSDGSAATGTWSITTINNQDVDATNMKVTFTAPPSGKVRITLNAITQLLTVTEFMYFGLRDSVGDVAGTFMMASGQINAGGSMIRGVTTHFVSGLTAGTSYTYKWAWRISSASGSGRIHTGPNDGPAIMEVWGVNI